MSEHDEKKAFLAGFRAGLAYADSDEHEPDPATAWRVYRDHVKPFEDEDRELSAMFDEKGRIKP